jgi:hypothetical protein
VHTSNKMFQHRTACIILHTRRHSGIDIKFAFSMLQWTRNWILDEVAWTLDHNFNIST